ncbi:hypothetical protein bcere0029_7660 [Bacillus cereus AH1272]|nr:hypothetical protein bcere0029_7660 [Bacillus cereus AH1272]EEL95178.1 hypothetical protein bcere0030_7530 [Bacillus cereus AH1273]
MGRKKRLSQKIIKDEEMFHMVLILFFTNKKVNQSSYLATLVNL